MNESDCCSLVEISAELNKRCPEAPLLALGQTVFWDEPMKGGILQSLRALGDGREFFAGVHDTDYFAKISLSGKEDGFVALPHNDTTTKNLWSAAGEFSSLFGSETVITKEVLAKHGGKLGRIEQERPKALDQITEAYGWRGVVSLHKDPKTTAGKSLEALFPHIYETLQWAIHESLELISGPHADDSKRSADEFLKLVCDHASLEQNKTLGDFFESLLKPFYDRVSGSELDIHTTRTTKLLALTQENSKNRRFDIVRLFLNDETRGIAEEAYYQSVRGSQIYTLDRFGVGALPFDLVIPGVGRGTLRLGNKGGLVMTESPLGFSYKKRPQTVEELSVLIENKFGSGCTLVGKAVTLILMLATEFIFVFHDGASNYVHRSAKMSRLLADKGQVMKLNPILRVHYSPWDALSDCCAWIKLPKPMQRPFGVEELCAHSFSRRWRQVSKDQTQLLDELKKVRRPIRLIKFLQEHVGGQWNVLAQDYEGMQSQLDELNKKIQLIKEKKAAVLSHLRALKSEVDVLEHEKGRHWRAKIFERDHSQNELDERKELIKKISEKRKEIDRVQKEFLLLDQKQIEMVNHEEIEEMRSSRQKISLEAELMRLNLIRSAIVTRDGLDHAGKRPSAWWFPLICPNNTWFNSTMKEAQYWLEELS